MILKIAWEPMHLICAIAVMGSIGSAAVIIAWAIYKVKRPRLPRCRDCYYCKPIPDGAGPYFHCAEHHCALHRGMDESFNVPVSVVTDDGYCSNFIPKNRVEDGYV